MKLEPKKNISFQQTCKKLEKGNNMEEKRRIAIVGTAGDDIMSLDRLIKSIESYFEVNDYFCMEVPINGITDHEIEYILSDYPEEFSVVEFEITTKTKNRVYVERKITVEDIG